MRNLKIFVVCLLLLLSCNKDKDKPYVEKQKINIDAVLIQAQNLRLEKKERLQYLRKAQENLKLESYSLSDREKYYQLAAAYFINDNKNKYYDILEHVKDKCLQFKDTFGLIHTECQIANYHISNFKIDSAYYYLSGAEKLSVSFKDKPFIGTILLSKADLEFFQKDFAGAEVKAVEALRNATLKEDHRLMYDCYITIGNSLVGLNDFEKAIEYYEKAIHKSVELTNDLQYFNLKAQPYNYIAKIFQKQGKYDLALSKVNTALAFSPFRKSDPTMYCYLLNNKAYSKFKLGDKKCLSLFEETLKVGDSLQSIPIQLTSKLYLSEYYLSQRDSSKAMRYSNEARALAHTNNVFEDELKALELLAKIDPANGANYNQRYITLNDSLQNVERATRNKFARIEFETDEITNQKNLAEAEKEKISAQRWMILGFSLFFIVSLLLLYVSRLQRSKNRELQYLQKQQKANEEIYRLMLDQQQKIEEGKQIEKRRISKELHDGIMGKLTAIRLNLFVLGKKTDPETITRCLEHVDEIQNIEKEIRKIAHDLNQNLFTDVSDFTLMVNNLVDNIKEHSEIRFKIVADEKIDWNIVKSIVKMQVYRILQEALLNIEKYAQAKNVVISMLEKEGKLSVTISDDGIGFEGNSTKNGIGHKNMRERAAEINGEFMISSIVGKGTKINLIIPT